MSQYKNNSKPEIDKNGEVVKDAQTVKFSIQKRHYSVAPGETIDVPEEHDEFVHSRGLALELVKPSKLASKEQSLDSSESKGGKPAAPPPFAGDVKSGK